MNTTKCIGVALMGALLALASGCAANEELNDKATEGGGKQITITAGTDIGSNTRVAYDDDKIGGMGDPLTWELGDKLSVSGYTYTGDPMGETEYVLKDEDAGKSVGSFVGNEITGANIYNVDYRTYGQTFDVQTQVGRNNTAHLKKSIILQAYGIDNLNNITLSMNSSILKFELTNCPPRIGLLTKLRWIAETATGTRTLELLFPEEGAGIVNIDENNNSLTAYLSFPPEEMSIKPGGKFRLELVGEETAYYAEKTVVNGKKYEPGYRYTAEVDNNALQTMEWKERIVVKLSLADEKINDYDNFPIEIGHFQDGNSVKLAAGTIQNGKAIINPSLLTPLKANSDIWICIPKVAKFFHTLGAAGLGDELILPDKDAGSTLLDEPKVGGKSYLNDWIVALYMGVNKNGDPDGKPLYWATGNLIATKLNGAGEATQTGFHVATDAETILEANATPYFLPSEITEDVTDGYSACDVGAQWNQFVWCSASPASTTLEGQSPQFVLPQMVDGNLPLTHDVCSYGLKRGFRLPVGTDSESGDNHEMSLLINGMVQDVSIELWNLNGTPIGREATYRKDKVTNTLRFPAAGSVYGQVPPSDLGKIGYYWCATTRIEDGVQGATYYVFYESDSYGHGLMEPTTRIAMRPVTE